MATTKKTTEKTGNDRIAEKIIKSYKEYMLVQGHEPPSVFQFMRELKSKEEDFYKYFGSFDSVKKGIWTDFFKATHAALEADPAYASYSVREKLLSFYYTLIEVLKKDRSYVLVSLKGIQKPELAPSFLKEFKEHFKNYVMELVNEGLATEEIVKRPVISERYHDGLWLQLMFVINFWVKDDSANFEKTDAAIEKSVNLSFELMGRGPLDMMVDFAKFLYQNR